MCLSKIREKKPRVDIKIAWKIFDKTKYGNINFHYLPSKKRLPEGQWVIDKNLNTIKNTFCGPYKSGYHAFVKKADAIRYVRHSASSRMVVRKVKVKDIVVYGWQYYNHGQRETVVFRKMFIYKNDVNLSKGK